MTQDTCLAVMVALICTSPLISEQYFGSPQLLLSSLLVIIREGPGGEDHGVQGTYHNNTLPQKPQE
jgi:hypothetical protein